ncbi:MAG: 2-oxoacid:acceptor oxidoreductase family protein [Anaerolineae bacterium]|nr:2-oxoacid:acceptor oxidoreductase family protein [Anaerolineae bacterium]
MQQECLFSGFGGQGVMFAGQLLAYAAMSEGFHVTWIPSYGPEMRGGTAHCFVVISDQPIGSPMVKHPQAAVVFNQPSYEKYEPLVATGGLLAFDSSVISASGLRADITDLAVPAARVAEELGNIRLANVVMLGAMLTARPIMSLKSIESMLDEHIPPHRRDLLGANIDALRKGAALAADYVGS